MEYSWSQYQGTVPRYTVSQALKQSTIQVLSTHESKQVHVGRMIAIRYPGLRQTDGHACMSVIGA